jgi:hypothetical protein
MTYLSLRSYSSPFEGTIRTDSFAWLNGPLGSWKKSALSPLGLYTSKVVVVVVESEMKGVAAAAVICEVDG